MKLNLLILFVVIGFSCSAPVDQNLNVMEKKVKEVFTMNYSISKLEGLRYDTVLLKDVLEMKHDELQKEMERVNADIEFAEKIISLQKGITESPIQLGGASTAKNNLKTQEEYKKELSDALINRKVLLQRDSTLLLEIDSAKSSVCYQCFLNLIASPKDDSLKPINDVVVFIFDENLNIIDPYNFN